MKISTDFPLASDYPIATEMILIQTAWKAIDEQGTIAFPSQYVDMIEKQLNSGNTIAVFRVKPKKQDSVIPS